MYLERNTTSVLDFGGAKTVLDHIYYLHVRFYYFLTLSLQLKTHIMEV